MLYLTIGIISSIIFLLIVLNFAFGLKDIIEKSREEALKGPETYRKLISEKANQEISRNVEILVIKDKKLANEYLSIHNEITNEDLDLLREKEKKLEKINDKIDLVLGGEKEILWQSIRNLISNTESQEMYTKMNFMRFSLFNSFIYLITAILAFILYFKG